MPPIRRCHRRSIAIAEVPADLAAVVAVRAVGEAPLRQSTLQRVLFCCYSAAAAALREAALRGAGHDPVPPVADWR